MSNLLSSNAKRLFNYSKISGKGSKYAYSFLNHGNNSSHPTFCLKISNRRCDDAKQFFTFITMITLYLTLIIGYIVLNFFGNYYIMGYSANVIKNEQLIYMTNFKKLLRLLLILRLDILARLTSDLQEISNF